MGYVIAFWIFVTSLNPVMAATYSAWADREGEAGWSVDRQATIDTAYTRARQSAIDGCLNNNWDDYDIRFRSCSTWQRTEYAAAPRTSYTRKGTPYMDFGLATVTVYYSQCSFWQRCIR